MEKTKRLSKSSIAVIVLAILLVLSMVMGLTGAWFTASDAGTGSSTLNFGKVNIDVVNDAVVITPTLARPDDANTNEVNEARLQPGDKYTVEATVKNSADVEMYVFVEATTTVTIGGVAYSELYDAQQNGTKLFEVSRLAYQGSTWTPVTGYVDVVQYIGAEAHKGTLYLVAFDDVADAEFEAEMTLAAATPNKVWAVPAAGGARTQVTLNDAENAETSGNHGEYATVEIIVTCGLNVWAIQSAHQNDAGDAAAKALAAMSNMGFSATATSNSGS